MTIKEFPITNKLDWLENRLLDVTSTEVSALFDVNPYQTEFELYNHKKDKVVINLEDNERMAWGRRLEDSIAQGCAESQGWDVEPFDVYMSNTKTFSQCFGFLCLVSVQTRKTHVGNIRVNNLLIIPGGGMYSQIRAL
mgnify:CR=1 FL=1